MAATYDSIIESVGAFGKYQKWTIFLLLMPIIFSGMQVLAHVFIFASPTHRCFISNCDTANSKYDEPWQKYTVPPKRNPLDNTFILDGCQSPIHTKTNSCSVDAFDGNVTRTCSHYVYSRETYIETLVTQFDLVCEREWLVPLSESIFMIGITFGCIVFGYVSDKYGRKPCMVFCLFFLALVGTVQAFCPDYWTFVILRFLVAFFQTGMYLSIFVSVVEMVGKDMRMACGVTVTAFFAVGEVMLAGTAYFIRDWFWLQLVTSIPVFIFVFYYWFIPESGRWLLLNRKYDKAKVLFEGMAKTNRVRLDDAFYHDFREMVADEEASRNHDKREEKTYNALDLMRTPVIRKRAINVILNWFMNTIVYYGLSLNSSNLQGNDFTNFAAVSAIEIPAYIFCILVVDRLGRRWSVCGLMVFGGFSCLAVTVIPSTSDYSWLVTCMAMAGKFGSASAFAIIYVYTSELFPTVMRNTAIGCSSMVAHFGGMLAPFIAQLGNYYPALPMMIFGANSILVGLMCLFLPETLGMELPETVADVEGKPEADPRCKLNSSKKKHIRSRQTDTDSKWRYNFGSDAEPLLADALKIN